MRFPTHFVARVNWPLRLSQCSINLSSFYKRFKISDLSKKKRKRCFCGAASFCRKPLSYQTFDQNFFSDRHLTDMVRLLVELVGNCDIDFLNFCHRQVQNFKISNLYKQKWNFGAIFWKYWKQNWKSTKYFTTSRKPSVIALKFHEMSSVSWNVINYCKISKFLVKSYKSLKDLRKILIKWLRKKQSNIAIILLTFIHALKNGWKLDNFCL
jgi:hypothetical protein